MAERINEVQRDAILRLLAQGLDRQTIAYQVGVTPGQVSAVAAHVKMGTYSLPSPGGGAMDSVENCPAAVAAGLGEVQPSADAPAPPVRLLDRLAAAQPPPAKGRLVPVFLGADAETGQDVHWNPDPDTGTANPHVLVLGESGFGKTYTISALLAELSKQRVTAIVFDYGQGFSREVAPKEFVEIAAPQEIHASEEGVSINPLQIFPSDIHGPLNVAQRVADTFLRVYPKLGVQQHSVLRQAVIDALAEHGIQPDLRESWTQGTPPFCVVQERLTELAEGPQTAQSRVAASTASHISTVFVFNTFRESGRPLSWGEMLTTGGVFVIQLKGLDYSLERAVTEFLLWNLIGYVDSLGPSPLRCFVVLDEALRMRQQHAPQDNDSVFYDFAPWDLPHLWKEGKEFLKLGHDDRFVMNCLQGTYCIRLARRGVPIVVLQKLAGIGSLQSARRYSRFYPSDRLMLRKSSGRANWLR